MTGTDIANFQSAVGEFIDAIASYRQIVAYQGVIAAMQAENAARAARGLGPAYSESDFYKAGSEFGF